MGLALTAGLPADGPCSVLATAQEAPCSGLFHLSVPRSRAARTPASRGNPRPVPRASRRLRLAHPNLEQGRPPLRLALGPPQVRGRGMPPEALVASAMSAIRRRRFLGPDHVVVGVRGAARVYRELLEAWTQYGPGERDGGASLHCAAGGRRAQQHRDVDRVGLSRPTVNNWKKRYQAEGLAGLENRVNPGRPPRKVAEGEVVARTLESPPGRLGVTLVDSAAGGRVGAEQGHDGEGVAALGAQPWKHQAFAIATVPELATTLRDSVGFYLHQPNKAVVLRLATRSPRSTRSSGLRLILPPSPRRPASPPGRLSPPRPREPIEAIEAAAGQVDDTYFDHHRDQEFLRFLKRVAKAYPRVKLHVVVDGYLVGDIPRFLPGSSATRESPCIPPRPAGPGSTCSRCSSGSSSSGGQVVAGASPASTD